MKLKNWFIYYALRSPIRNQYFSRRTNDIFVQCTLVGENETFPGTLSLCPDSDTKLLNASTGQRHYDDLRSLRGRSSTTFNAPLSYIMHNFQTFLELKEYVGLHEVALQTNNRTAAELQEALTYVWLPSLEKSNWTATHAEILEIHNGTIHFSRDGSPLMVIRYILPVSDAISPANCSSHLQRFPWMYASNSKYHELTPIVPPLIGSLVQRMQENGLTVYEGPVFYKDNGALDYVFLRANSTDSFLDIDQLKADMTEVVQQSRFKQQCGSAGMSDWEIHFGQLQPGIVPSRDNGSFTYVIAMSIPFVIRTREKILVRDFMSMVPLLNHTDRYYLVSKTGLEKDFKNIRIVDNPPLNTAFSFRMHLDRPLSGQWLPLLEVAMQSQLNIGMGKSSTAEVRLWDFDPDAAVVKFFVLLPYPASPLREALDARLPYATSIYRKLDGLQFRLPSTNVTYTLMRFHLPGHMQDVVKASASAPQCQSESAWSCLPVEEQLKETFSLYVEWVSFVSHNQYLPNGFFKELPNSDKVLDALQQAFAISNNQTGYNNTLTITVTERDDNLKTTKGRDATRFTFALTYPEMPSQFDWKPWRYPSFDDLNSLLQSIAKVKIVRTWTVAVSAFS
ncbi:uncharacterized protein LOC129586036 isoform X2 [Paramacrobiotus metropolitanus]|uniref:uncharacterized protein LOC129586036 isoform X2 n=1 Tax=Paramacrobiotus metropolitanus TaxID=2943436 RepID=UPI002445876F|nr:uncharacterized protein LOC129586036 isoform X2 [Paramacrobiotus metropolitanus]